MFAGIKHSKTDWLLSRKNSEEAIKAIEDRGKVSRKFDVPDLAGYARNGVTFYIDKDCPNGFDFKGSYLLTDRFLLLHELVEDAILKLFRSIEYQDAHQVADLAEKEAVETVLGVEVFPAYAKFMMEQVDKAWSKKGQLRVPPDLDVKPYADEKEKRKLADMGYYKNG
jgi:hypothetical protein